MVDRAEGTFDFVQVFAKDLEELEKLAPVAAQAVEHDGLFWVSYPKKRASSRNCSVSRSVSAMCWGNIIASLARNGPTSLPTSRTQKPLAEDSSASHNRHRIPRTSGLRHVRLTMESLSCDARPFPGR